MLALQVKEPHPSAAPPPPDWRLLGAALTQFTPRSSALVRATKLPLRVSHAHKSPEVSPVKANTPSNEKQQAATLQRGGGGLSVVLTITTQLPLPCGHALHTHTTHPTKGKHTIA